MWACIAAAAAAPSRRRSAQHRPVLVLDLSHGPCGSPTGTGAAAPGSACARQRAGGTRCAWPPRSLGGTRDRPGRARRSRCSARGRRRSGPPAAPAPPRSSARRPVARPDPRARAAARRSWAGPRRGSGRRRTLSRQDHHQVVLDEVAEAPRGQACGQSQLGGQLSLGQEPPGSQLGRDDPLRIASYARSLNRRARDVSPSSVAAPRTARPPDRGPARVSARPGVRRARHPSPAPPRSHHASTRVGLAMVPVPMTTWSPVRSDTRRRPRGLGRGPAWSPRPARFRRPAPAE